MVKPIKIVLFFLVIFAGLALISLVMPKNGITLSANTTIHFPKLSDFFSKDTVEYADISDILENNAIFGDSSSMVATDTLNVGSIGFDTIRADAAKLRAGLVTLEFPDSGRTNLDGFFAFLNKVPTSKELIRILHYGDSQIEGDRITSYIRNKLQTRFGGSGPGMLPVIQPYGQFSMEQEVQGEWKRYTVFGNRDTTLEHDKYGALASFSRFTHHLYDSTSAEVTEASFTVRESPRSYPNARRYNRFRIFYGNNKKPFVLEMYHEDSLMDARTVQICESLNVLEWRFSKNLPSLTLNFTGDDSPDFYALAFDAFSGVAVDNIPMRGSSGLIFSKMDQEHLASMYSQLNVKLLILQFGGNVVPYIQGKTHLYERWFLHQLKTLKKLFPNIPIIVIGLADMSVNDKGNYITNPNVKDVRKALKNATFKAHCVYWDMYQAMGGYNSMPSWVFADPPLATSDFVHFNHRGAKLIAEMFYKAFMAEYNSYLERSASITKPENTEGVADEK